MPCFLWFDRVLFGGVETDIIIEGVALVGALCGALALAGLHHVSVLGLCYLCYLSLFIVGQRWLSFQWDIFLLETGAAAVLYSRWWGVGRATRPQPAVAWVLRALWVKFMLMSGAVKVQADCVTWKRLTALEFHFASTCLPTAEAWAMHSLPPLLLRAGVAFMFVAEIIAPPLLLVPVRRVRRLGVLMQLPLQAGIMLTGNYNWFNLHTAVLLLPAWDDDRDPVAPTSSAWPPLLGPLLVRALHGWDRAWNTRVGRAAATVGALALLTHGARTYFALELSPDVHARLVAAVERPWGERTARALHELGARLLADPSAARLRNLLDRRATDSILAALLSWRALALLYATLILTGLAHACSPPPGGRCTRLMRCAWRVLLCGAATVWLGMTLLPLDSIAPGHAAPPLPLAAKLSASLAAAAQPFHASSSYGLFRRMTGVGDVPPSARSLKWGGVPPSVVAVPAVVVEGTADGTTWLEVPFRYAPYTPERAPRRTAPHQPRLDWQMWFAALGSYQQNPWLLHLLWKLLHGAEEVEQLLDLDAYPFTAAPPRQLRASLYHYDFTRAPSPWARRLPGAQVVNLTVPAERNLWWARTRVAEYVPAVSVDSLRQVASSQGWTTGKGRQGRPPCAALERRGAAVAAGRAAHFAQRAFCTTVLAARIHGAPLRRFVGWRFAVPEKLRRRCPASWRWAAEGSVVFVDGPMIIILLAVSMPLLLVCMAPAALGAAARLVARVLASCRAATRRRLKLKEE